MLDGRAQVLLVDANALFNGGDVRATVTPLPLGPHRGIRDMVAVRDGFLLLTGPDDDPAQQNTGWTVVWWDGKHTPEHQKPAHPGGTRPQRRHAAPVRQGNQTRSPDRVG